MELRVPETAYQVTDLARHRTEVIQAARRNGALIRDKDGTVLLLLPAHEVAMEQGISHWLLEYVRLARFLESDPESRDRLSLGELGWAADLSEQSIRGFARELRDALLVAVGRRDLDEVELVVDEWQATARAWSDADVRARLLDEDKSPLTDVDL